MSNRRSPSVSRMSAVSNQVCPAGLTGHTVRVQRYHALADVHSGSERQDYLALLPSIIQPLPLLFPSEATVQVKMLRDPSCERVNVRRWVTPGYRVASARFEVALHCNRDPCRSQWGSVVPSCDVQWPLVGLRAGKQGIYHHLLNQLLCEGDVAHISPRSVQKELDDVFRVL